MSNRFPPYVKAGRCRSGPQPGARALMAWCLDWPSAGNSGIFNCRRVAGTQVRSLHGEGRAIDVSFPVVNGRAHASGWALVRALLPHVGTLGIQCIIWDRTIWSASSPNGARYRGAHAHTDHIHVELTWHAANYLNLATVRAVMNGAKNVVVAPKPPPVPEPTPPISDLEDEEDMATYHRSSVALDKDDNVVPMGTPGSSQPAWVFYGERYRRISRHHLGLRQNLAAMTGKPFELHSTHPWQLAAFVVEFNLIEDPR